MKNCLYLLLLVASRCISCESADMETFRRDVEQAFAEKSFLGIASSHGDSHPVEVTLENEYDDDDPTVTPKFNSVHEFSEWFFEKHQYHEHMIIPGPATCRDRGCKYQLPELTLHHAVYLLGFDSKKVAGCTLLTRIHLYWA